MNKKSSSSSSHTKLSRSFITSFLCLLSLHFSAEERCGNSRGTNFPPDKSQLGRGQGSGPIQDRQGHREQRDGKLREDPGSYRPVSILPAISKVLESLVKGDLKAHLKRVNGLPGSQYGLRLKRSCTSALAHAQAGWLSGTA
jgi:hypothetical protein